MTTDSHTRRLVTLGIAVHIILISLATTVILHTQNSEVNEASRASFSFFTKEEPADPISFLFTGDIMLGRYIATLRDENGGDFPFTYMPELLEAAELELNDELDFVVGNLEGPVTDSDYTNPGTAMIFNFDPEVVPQQLKDAGFTTLSMANNHTLDMGVDGVTQTYNYLTAAGLGAYGHPDTPTGEFSTITYTLEGKTITFLGLNDAVISLDEEAAIAEVQRLNEETDFLIVSIHWGVEYLETAPENIETLARKLVDAGADFIHGHHPHRVQNNEDYNGAPIYYSLGNFVFDQYWSDYTQEGQVVLLQLIPTEDGFEINHQSWMVDLVNLGEPKLR
jgi:poly-gamma-glutamate synthesis protein (capsule biosynthesis protein)